MRNLAQFISKTSSHASILHVFHPRFSVSSSSFVSTRYNFATVKSTPFNRRSAQISAWAFLRVHLSKMYSISDCAKYEKIKKNLVLDFQPFTINIIFRKNRTTIDKIIFPVSTLNLYIFFFFYWKIISRQHGHKFTRSQNYLSCNSASIISICHFDSSLQLTK